MNIIEGSVIANTATVVIVVARFNRFINNNLLEGAIDTLKRIGHIQDKNITVIWVPGAYELPLAVKSISINNRYDAIIVLGTIIRGLTVHFEFILNSCRAALTNISIEHKLPIGLGLLATDDIGQAIERSGIKSNNKGTEAALAVLEMINVLKLIYNLN